MLRVNPKSTSYHGPFCVIPDRRRRRRLLLRAVLRDYPQGRLLRRPLPRSHQGYRVPRLLGAGGEGGGGEKKQKAGLDTGMNLCVFVRRRTATKKRLLQRPSGKWRTCAWPNWMKMTLCVSSLLLLKRYSKKKKCFNSCRCQWWWFLDLFSRSHPRASGWTNWVRKSWRRSVPPGAKPLRETMAPLARWVCFKWSLTKCGKCEAEALLARLLTQLGLQDMDFK